MNEFKFSTLRQFGSENFSFTANIQSEKTILTEQEVNEQIKQISGTIEKAFRACTEREISEKAILVESSERRTAEVAKLDAALKLEMAEKEKANKTMGLAEKLSKKLSK